MYRPTTYTGIETFNLRRNRRRPQWMYLQRTRLQYVTWSDFGSSLEVFLGLRIHLRGTVGSYGVPCGPMRSDVVISHTRDPVVYHRSTSSSPAAEVTPTSRHRRSHASLRCPWPSYIHQSWCLDEVTRRQDRLCLLCRTSSATKHPPLCSQTRSPVAGVVASPVAAGLR